MKKFFCFIACMMAIVQNTKAQDYFSSAANFARLYVGTVEPPYQIWLWNDCPYYKDNSDTYRGRISYYGVVYDDVQLRFDQFKQSIAVLSPLGNVFCMPEQEHVDWFEMDSYRYVHDPEDSLRYTAVLCDGSINGVQLYHTVWKVNGGDKLTIGERTPLKTLRTKEHYTLITAQGEMYHVKRA